MPEISRFFGIVITIYYKEHGPNRRILYYRFKVD